MLKKYLALALASIMLMGNCLAVEGVSEDMLPSKYAGEAIRCQVIVDDGDTRSDYFVNVPVPDGATLAQQGALVDAAARSVAMGSKAAPRAFGNFDVISEISAWSAIASHEMNMGGGTLPKDYATLMVRFDGLTVNNGATKLNVRVVNSSTPTVSYRDYDDINAFSVDAVVVFIEDRQYGGRTFQLKKNDDIDVYATTDKGGVLFDLVTVAASLYKIA